MSAFNFIDEYMTDDPKLGHIITKGTDGDVVLLGFPFDEGVRRNGGRVGSKLGPSTMRGFVQRMGTIVNPEYDFLDLRKLRISDAGDVTASSEAALEEAHENLTKKVFEILGNGGIPFVVGGGNDQSYPNASALLAHVQSGVGGKIGVINIDAHLDVRPKKEGRVHSGSPFRLLLEDERFKEGIFCEFAVQGSQCSAEHWNYVLMRPQNFIVPLSKLRNGSTSVAVEKFKECLSKLGDHIFVSFDIDSIISADCPGVSAPANVGLTAQEAFDICFIAGKTPQVKLFDMSEFNPQIEDYRTAKLVTFMFYHFLLGVASRTREGLFE
jgi:formiminoglutamase